MIHDRISFRKFLDIKDEDTIPDETTICKFRNALIRENLMETIFNQVKSQMAEKNLVYRGKSKDVFRITNGAYKGKYRFVFTDRGTGYFENGKPVFDPGLPSRLGNVINQG